MSRAECDRQMIWGGGEGKHRRKWGEPGQSGRSWQPDGSPGDGD